MYHLNVFMLFMQFFSSVCSRKVPMCSCAHIIQTLMHVVQLIVSYLLMLVFMTFNLYLCAAVVLGSGVGYFLFRWKRPDAEEKPKEDRCHN